jgi:hypothetical protein
VAPLVPAGDAPLAGALVVVATAVAFVYLYVGYRLSQRVVSPRGQLASYQLALWWGGLGVNTGLGAVTLALALANALPFALGFTLELIVVITDCAFLWGLVGFLTYVYTGKYYVAPLVGLYSVFYGLVVYYYIGNHPYGLAFKGWAVAVQYSGTGNLWLALVIIVILIGPELVGAILYLSLLRRTRVREQRSRIYLVGGGILLWFAIDVFFPTSSGAWVLARTVAAVIPGVMSLIAFYPPPWAQRWFGLTVAPGRREGPAIAVEP